MMNSPDVVFPACAGMFLSARCNLAWIKSFPRMRGDVPSRWNPARCWCRFSPHARGCSRDAVDADFPVAVFPACAGMFRPLIPGSELAGVFPACAGMFLGLGPRGYD